MSHAKPEPVPFCRPDISEREIREVVETLRSGWITTGPRVRRFESVFAEAVGAAWAVAVSSCTAGLHLSLEGLGCGKGDEVITPVFTFTASAAAVLEAGARPVLVDIEEDTLNMDPACVERALSSDTKVLLPVHMAGHPAEMDRLRQIADGRGLAIVEDAAHALPAAYRGTPIGALGNLTCFSFYATKNLTTGEGGMITGQDEQLRERLSIIGYHGMSRDGWMRYAEPGNWAYEIIERGYKYNLSDIAAALGLVQMERLEEMQQRRRQVVELYRKGFSDLEALILPASRGDVVHAWHLYVLRLRPGTLKIDRNRFIQELSERGIGTSVHFIPLSRHSYYQRELGVRPQDFPVAEQVFASCLSLPLFSAMTDKEVARVVDAVREVVQAHAR